MLWWVRGLETPNLGTQEQTQTEAEQEQQPDRYASHATVGGTEIYIYICCILNQQ